jgi:hypothetical protein
MSRNDLRPSGASFVPARHTPRDVAVGFYSRLVEAGFTGPQIFDLTLEILDQVAVEKRADLDVAEPIAAK